MLSYADLKVAELRSLCSERGLQTRGNKTVLLERLRQSEQPVPVLKQEQDEQMTESLLESTTPKPFEVSNIPVEQLESLSYSSEEPELMSSSILQDDDDDIDDPNMDIDDSERTPSEPMTPPLPSSLITEPTKPELKSVKQEQKISSGHDYFSLYTDQGDKTFKSSNDFAQIVVERKYLVNPAAVEQQSRRNASSPMVNSAVQFYQQPAVNGTNNLQLPYKYDQLFELTKHQWVYHDGETPRWFNYDTAAFAMKQPGVAVECILRR